MYFKIESECTGELSVFTTMVNICGQSEKPYKLHKHSLILTKMYYVSITYIAMK